MEHSWTLVCFASEGGVLDAFLGFAFALGGTILVICVVGAICWVVDVIFIKPFVNPFLEWLATTRAKIDIPLDIPLSAVVIAPNTTVEDPVRSQRPVYRSVLLGMLFASILGCVTWGLLGTVCCGIPFLVWMIAQNNDARDSASSTNVLIHVWLLTSGILASLGFLSGLVIGFTTARRGERLMLGSLRRSLIGFRMFFALMVIVLLSIVLTPLFLFIAFVAAGPSSIPRSPHDAQIMRVSREAKGLSPNQYFHEDFGYCYICLAREIWKFFR